MFGSYKLTLIEQVKNIVILDKFSNEIKAKTSEQNLSNLNGRIVTHALKITV